MFNKVIMNPAYLRSLHLKILDTVIKNCPTSEIVNLSPIRWLQDPLAEYKKSSDWKKFQMIRDRMTELEPVAAVEASALFSIGIFSDLGIYYFSPSQSSKVDTKNIWKKFKSPAAVMMIEKLIALPDSIEAHMESNKLDGIRVPMTNIGGNRGYKNVYKDLAYVVDGKKNGRWWYECKNMGGYEKPDGSPLPLSIKFDSENEAKNFYDSFFTKFMSWLCDITHTQQNLAPRLLPWLGDYSKTWTDKDLYEYFGLTEDEIEEIECLTK